MYTYTYVSTCTYAINIHIYMYIFICKHVYIYISTCKYAIHIHIDTYIHFYIPFTYHLSNLRWCADYSPYYISHARWWKAPVGLTKESSSSCGRGRVLVGFFHSPIWGGKETLGWWDLKYNSSKQWKFCLSNRNIWCKYIYTCWKSCSYHRWNWR